jgi:hypothetical protein
VGSGAGIAVAIALFGVAFFAGQAGLDLYRNVQVIREWPSTEGEILSGNVTEHRVRRLPLTRREYYQGDRYQYRYSSSISYGYTVDGQGFVSSQISMAKKFDAYLSTFSGRGDAAYEGTWLAKYPVGKHVTVYYDPNDPANALLERDEAWLAYLFFAVAGVLAFLGLGILNAVRHARSEPGYN